MTSSQGEQLIDGGLEAEEREPGDPTLSPMVPDQVQEAQMVRRMANKADFNVSSADGKDK